MMFQLNSKILIIVFWLVFLINPGISGDAGHRTDSATTEPDSGKKSIYERIWAVPKLYENGNNRVIQEFSLIGRYHGQYWSVRDDQVNEKGWENRRIFLGSEAKLFKNFTVQLQIKVSEDLNPVYDGFYQAFVKWDLSKSFSMSVGRLDFLFAGFERTVSSTRIITFERSLLTDQLMPHEVFGAVAQGNVGRLEWHAGILSGNIGDEFTDFSGGYGAVAGLGYKLPLFFHDGSIHLDYFYNNGNPENNALEPYDHVLSLWHQGRSGPLSLGIELVAAHGIEGRKSVFGLTFMPGFELGKNVILNGDALTLVIRYQYATSDGPNGLVLQQRYEQEVVPDGLGDNYNAGYLGLNWLIFGNRFKFMSGVEYSAMKDSEEDGGRFKGLTYLAGIRLYF